MSGMAILRIISEGAVHVVLETAEAHQVLAKVLRLLVAAHLPAVLERVLEADHNRCC